MAGNSRRRGAVRKTGSKKGAVVGSGGQRRRGLEGKGPTPKAGDRPNHKAYKSARRAESTAEPRKAAPARESKRAGGKAASTEVIAGRNSVVEALRSSVPASALYVAGRIDSDDRVREAIASVKAINAARLAVLGDGSHRVTLDQAIKTMRDTGADMKSKYKETSRGGLAVNVIEC